MKTTLKISNQAGKLILPNFILIINLQDSRKNSYVEAFKLNVTIFGEKACKELIKVKWGCNGGALIQQGWCPYKKRKRHEFPLPCEGTVRRQSISQKESSCQELNQLTPWSGNSSQNCENIKLCCLSLIFWIMCFRNHRFCNICVSLKMLSDLMWCILVIQSWGGELKSGMIFLRVRKGRFLKLGNKLKNL